MEKARHIQYATQAPLLSNSFFEYVVSIPFVDLI